MMMHHDTEQQEDVYQCVGCASLWPKTHRATDYSNGDKYCRTCNSRDLRLCSDEGDCDKE